MLLRGQAGAGVGLALALMLLVLSAKGLAVGFGYEPIDHVLNRLWHHRSVTTAEVERAVDRAYDSLERRNDGGLAVGVSQALLWQAEAMTSPGERAVYLRSARDMARYAVAHAPSNTFGWALLAQFEAVLGEDMPAAAAALEMSYRTGDQAAKLYRLRSRLAMFLWHRLPPATQVSAQADIRRYWLTMRMSHLDRPRDMIVDTAIAFAAVHVVREAFATRPDDLELFDRMVAERQPRRQPLVFPALEVPVSDIAVDGRASGRAD